MNFPELRQKHSKFIYQSFSHELIDGDLRVSFKFKTEPDIEFNPEIIFPNIQKERLEEISQEVLDNLVFNLGLVEMISYWKATCSPEIEIKAGSLNEDQISFWKKLLIKGLGEFFYQNQIDFTQDDLVKIECETSSQIPRFARNDNSLNERDLILVGGGKDSAVTLEEIKNSGKEFNCLLLNPTQAAKKVTEIGGCQDPIIIKRTIDPKLLELNSEGYLNGHTPFSAYLAFLATLAAHLYNYKNIVVSNESSSSEGNVEFHGSVVNHQYSKSLEFEQDFREYSKNYLSNECHYYSYLRELTELQIAERFSRMEKYHFVFRSCNKGSKQGIWCGQCSKCLFAYLILYPYLGQKTKEIFNKDLLNDQSLFPIMEELLQVPGRFKPFDCVGTKEEVVEAIKLGIEKSKEEDVPVPYLLNVIANPERVKQSSELGNSSLPGKIASSTSSPRNDGFGDDDSILILGLGSEGLSVLKYLQKHYPGKTVAVADKKEFSDLPDNVDQRFFGDEYLKHLEEFDVIIKSPGIPYLPEIKQAKENGITITSSTQIFFDEFGGQIIGVTGTKGKSTTSSLIYEVLKSGGLDVHLIGNIGNPALDTLDELKPSSIVVFELSSFQLNDLTKSPHIAVLLNIYGEHLDYHGTLEEYSSAKANITKFQSESDYLIFNEDNPEASKIAANSKAKKISFSIKQKEEVLEGIESTLIGEFNLLNIMPSVIIGRLFDISKEQITEAIKNFKPLPHRLEFVAEKNGIKFYNDSLATNPRATIAAIQSFGDDLETLIAGGFDRGLDYTELGEEIAKSHIKTLILFPDTGEKIWEAAKGFRNEDLGFRRFEVNSMEEAVKIAFEKTSSGKIVLMSPASASFNMFKDYKERGDKFRETILASKN